MDELDLLRTLRADGSPPSDAARARAERSWRRAATPPVDRRTPRHARAFAVAALVAMTALGIALVSGSRQGVEPAAAALRDAAELARSQPAAVLPPGTYRYQRILNVTTIFRAAHGRFDGRRRPQGFAFLARQRNTQDVWQGRGRGLERFTNERPVLPTARDRRGWLAAGRPALPPAGTLEVPLGAARPLRLPSDRDALYARFERRAARRASGRPSAYVFQLAGEALADPRATPAQRAALFEVLARVPGVVALGSRTDALGRRGLAFTMRDELDPSRTTLLVDPKTSQLLERSTRAAPGSPIPAGRVTWIATYGVPRIVSAIGRR